MQRIAFISMALGSGLALSALAETPHANRPTPQIVFQTEERLQELLAEDELNEPVVLALCSRVQGSKQIEKMDDVAAVIAKVRMRAAIAVEVSHKFPTDLEKILENAKVYNKITNQLKRTCIWNMNEEFFARARIISEKWRKDSAFAPEAFELKIEKKMEEIKRDIDRRNG